MTVRTAENFWVGSGKPGFISGAQVGVYHLWNSPARGPFDE